MELDTTISAINSASLPNSDTASTQSISSQDERINALFHDRPPITSGARPLTDPNRHVSRTRDEHDAINTRIQIAAATHISMSEVAAVVNSGSTFV